MLLLGRRPALRFYAEKIDTREKLYLQEIRAVDPAFIDTCGRQKTIIRALLSAVNLPPVSNAPWSGCFCDALHRNLSAESPMRILG
jgi:hypothetical protein